MLKCLIRRLFKEYAQLKGIKVEMKNRIKKEEYKITFLYGGVLFLVGLIGMIFPATANYIVTFCFIYGGSSLLIGLLYFGTHKVKFQNKKHEKNK